MKLKLLSIKNPARSGISNLLNRILSDSFFLNPCALTASLSLEEEFGPAYLTCFVQGNRLDVGGGDWESPFNTDTIRNFSDRESGCTSLSLALDHITLEALDPLLVALNDFIIDGDVVTGLEFGKVADGCQLLVNECDGLIHNQKFGRQK